MSIIGKKATWHTYDDATGEEIQIPVIIMDMFYEPGDAVPGYNLRHAVTGQPYGGIDARDVVINEGE